MKHEEAKGTLAAVRYTLGEMSAEERDTFEHHYFECNECWADVRRAEMFSQNAKVAAKFEQRKRRPVPWVAAAAAAAVLMVFGLGPIRAWLAAMPKQGEIAHLYLAGEMRGADDQANILPAREWATLLVDILPVDSAASYRLVLRGEGLTRQLDVSPEKAKNTVQWLLRPLPAGSYELVVESVDRGGRRSETARHSIRVGGS